MKVHQAMRSGAKLAHPDDTLQFAACIMCKCDLGFLPVGVGDRLAGTITDRDIAVRAVACGASPDERVGDFMTRDARYCYEDDDLDDVLEDMAELKVRRLPVVDHHKRLLACCPWATRRLEDHRKTRAMRFPRLLAQAARTRNGR